MCAVDESPGKQGVCSSRIGSAQEERNSNLNTTCDIANDSSLGDRAAAEGLNYFLKRLALTNHTLAKIIARFPHLDPRDRRARRIEFQAAKRTPPISGGLHFGIRIK